MHTYIIIKIFTLWSSIFELMMIIKIGKNMDYSFKKIRSQKTIKFNG